MTVPLRPTLSLSLTLVFSCLLFYTAHSQQRCATVEYEKIRRKLNPKLEDPAIFEKWLNDKSSLKTQGTQKTQSTSYQVPVVVHVIHNGEPIGTGTNISDAQILSQITVLNEDFKRLNADASQTPTEFLNVAGSLDIQFVMAKQDPLGSSTNGIVRVKGSKTSWTFNDNEEFKSLSYWSAENYLNIWVLNLTDFLGYAQFPISSLPGLENSPPDEKTDGVAVAYQAFGKGPYVLEPRYNKGRTATHELGHFFGLKHIWDEISSGCTNDNDYVTDTPKQNSSTTTCPTHPQAPCSANKMFQNYLDYTDDVCMNLFTIGQISRMKTVLSNSPRRLSLLSSPGLLSPTGDITNLKMIDLEQPSPVSCKSNAVPVISIKNVGTISINSFNVEVLIDGTLTNQFVSGIDLPAGEEQSFSLNSIELNEGSNVISINVTGPNGIPDDLPADNSLTTTRIINSSTDFIPLRQNFDNTIGPWAVYKEGQEAEWTSVFTNKNTSLVYEAFSNPIKGEESWLVSPTLDLSKVLEASVFYEVSYAIRTSSSTIEHLKILSSKDCGVIFDKLLIDIGGDQIAVKETASSWVPKSTSDWKSLYLNLSSLVGQKDARIAFVITNDNGNNFYLDNIEFFIDDDPNPLSISELYTIYNSTLDFKITFNLPEREDVRLQIYTTLGQVVLDNILPETLNQTYQVDMTNQTSGLYIVRMQIGNQLAATKVFLSH